MHRRLDDLTNRLAPRAALHNALVVVSTLVWSRLGGSHLHPTRVNHTFVNQNQAGQHDLTRSFALRSGCSSCSSVTQPVIVHAYS